MCDKHTCDKHTKNKKTELYVRIFWSFFYSQFIQPFLKQSLLFNPFRPNMQHLSNDQTFLQLATPEWLSYGATLNVQENIRMFLKCVKQILIANNCENIAAKAAPTTRPSSIRRDEALPFIFGVKGLFILYFDFAINKRQPTFNNLIRVLNAGKYTYDKPASPKVAPAPPVKKNVANFFFPQVVASSPAPISARFAIPSMDVDDAPFAKYPTLPSKEDKKKPIFSSFDDDATAIFNEDENDAATVIIDNDNEDGSNNEDESDNIGVPAQELKVQDPAKKLIFPPNGSKCCAQTKSGSRCSRDAKNGNFCAQHFNLNAGAQAIIDNNPNQVESPRLPFKPSGTRCCAKTARGTRCQNNHVVNSNFCTIHDRMYH